MSDILTLDDGRLLEASSLAMSGFLQMVADQLSDQNANLKRWLIDVSERTNGMMGIDLRGLDPPIRDAFHAAARAAHGDANSGRAKDVHNSRGYATLARFIAMQDSINRGESPDTLTDGGVCDGEPFTEDLNEIWRPGSGQ